MSDFEITRSGGQTRVTVRGKLTVTEIPVLQPALKQEISAGVREMIFDLTQMSSLDSSGIGLLIAANNSLATVQGTLRLVNVSPDILKLLQSMRLVDRLHATADEKEMSDG
ncbi:MAG: STAS domain-containing protein [Geoalkalibacter sp.]|jgi:anti-anti-sigma factor|uniref:STAS domain-containing protein n=1 Tax=Geoalkalibacter sp. TaxID=3041440 RepID=UPI002A50FB09|nr:STAS domain-containing protein [Desulfofustis sp.]